MRIETTTRELYKFEELTEESQNKAIIGLHYINVDHDWWDCTYDEAKELGCEISAFDIGRGNSINFKFVDNSADVAEKIIKTHGESCDTYILSKAYLKDYKKLDQCLTGCMICEESLEELEIEFSRAIGEEYLHMLRREYEYLSGDEAIKETIVCNDYEFTKQGEL